jgi:MFS family permease
VTSATGATSASGPEDLGHLGNLGSLADLRDAAPAAPAASGYRAVFAPPGSLAFSMAGFIGRMPISMLSIGVVTMISQLTGRYRLAGALSATLALSAAVLGPQVSRLVDRHGQSRVLRPAATVTVAAVSGLLLCVRAGAPSWAYFPFAVAAGTTPSLGALVRARWAALHGDTPALLHTAYSLEAVLDEVCFILGPILSIGLSTVWFPEAGPLLAMCFLAAGTTLLTAQRATEPEPHPRTAQNSGSALRIPALRALVAVFAAVGAVFGSVDVTTVAFAKEHGHPAAASVVLATYAAGSCLAGAVFGMLRPRGSAANRFLVGILAFAVSMIPPLLAGNLVFLAVALFASGLTVAPTMVTTMALVERHVPRARLTEGMTWVTTGLAGGVALGASPAGWVIDASGAHAAFTVAISAAVLAAGAACWGHHRLRPVPEEEGYGDGEHRDRAGGPGEPEPGGRPGALA